MNFRAQKLQQAVIATLLLTGSVGVIAQSKTIELQTDEGLLTIPLDDNAGLDIGADGKIFTTAGVCLRPGRLLRRRRCLTRHCRRRSLEHFPVNRHPGQQFSG